MRVLILTSPDAQALPQSRKRVRAARRMRTATAWPSCFETPRCARLLSMRATVRGAFWPNEARWKNQPAAARKRHRPRSIVSGLLFTMNGATSTCRAVSARSADTARNDDGATRCARSHRAALAQHVERDAMALDRRRKPAIERDQQQNVANLLRRAAVGERAVDVDAKLVRTPDRRRHRDRGQRFRLERQRGTAPDVAIGIGVDHVLQRLAECAQRVHALLDRGATEHLPAKLQSFVMQVARIHRSLSPYLEPRLSLPGIARRKTRVNRL